jgi:hypothetical protein
MLSSMKAHALIAALLLFAPACSDSGGAECAVNCAKSDACSDWGECGEDPGCRCVVRDDADCRQSALCPTMGFCSLDTVQGRCVVVLDSDCKASKTCVQDGWCGAVNGDCIAVSSADCASAEICEFIGKCTLEAADCAAASDADCADSQICRHEGLCTAVKGECVN